MSDDAPFPGKPAFEAEEGETVFLGPSGAAVKGEPPLATQPAAGSESRSGGAGTDELARGSVVDRFVILDVVGRGGMGVVYSAYDPDLDRKIALKLVRPNRPGAGEGQLLREAQAIARLSHPNVVAVYDVGTHRDQVFLALELVEGRNLGPWLAQTRRSVREILEVFAAAGRGLAAAHAAGLVHRDFKPDNVLIGNDGRVRVADFGVARRFESSGDEPADFPDLPEEALSARSTRSTMAVAEATRFGIAVGTVPYMAPEQLRRGVADARSDQFAFSIALFEALYGERPFAGQGALELALAMESGELRTPNPSGRRVPPAVRAAIARGLAFDPAARFPSMDGLLAALAHDPEAARRRRWGIAAAVAIFLVAGFGLRELALRRARVCAGGEAKVEELWNPRRKAAVHDAFRATGLPFAEETWAGVERALDRYTSDWAGMHREACEATRVRGEQSEALLDRRMFCLDQKLRDAGALIDLFRQADGAVVEKSVAASADLPALASCADLSALNARVPPPSDPKIRAAVRSVGQQVAAARASFAAGRYQTGLEPARRAVAAAGKIAYPPIRAEALAVLGGFQERTEDFAAARETLHSAWWTAEAGADDEVKTRAATELMRVERLQTRFDAGSDWGRFAAATLDRLGSEPSLKAGYLLELGLLRSEEGKYDEALAPLREAVALRRRSADRAELVGPLGSLGMVLHRNGEHESARKAYEEALALGRRELGAEHPEVASMLQRVGNLLFDQGRFEESAAYSRQALAIREKVLGADHYQVGSSLNSLGNALSELGRQGEALACYERAAALQGRAFGESSPGVAVTLNNMANVYLKQRRFDLTEKLFRRVYEIRTKALGPEHPSTALALHNLGVTLDQSGRPGEALAWFERALRISEKALGPDHPNVIETLLAIADAEIHQGRPERALPPLERAWKTAEKGGLDADLGGRTRFALASALRGAKRDPARAKAIAERALADFASLGKDGEDSRKDVEEWLAGRGKS